MKTLGVVAVWGLFFASSVYGHVAMKLATGHDEAGSDGGGGLLRAWALATDPWTVSGVASWCLSGALWVAILDGSSLSGAMSISALRYVLVVVAAFAVLHERVAPRQWLGVGLIALGIGLVTWKGEGG